MKRSMFSKLTRGKYTNSKRLDEDVEAFIASGGKVIRLKEKTKELPKTKPGFISLVELTDQEIAQQRIQLNQED